MADAGVHIIGTSHVSKESVDKVSSYILEHKPDIVAVELDARRAHALLHGAKPKLSLGMIKVMGIKGFLFFALASFLQKKIGQVVGMEPGSDMKTAIISASKVNSKIALIDRRIEVTMRRLSEGIGWRERFRFFFDMLLGPFSKEMREFGKIDLRKVPSKELVTKVIGRVRQRYPAIYRVLVEERNEHMATVLASIVRGNPESSILAVVGAGHEDDLARMLKEKLARTAKVPSP